MRLFPVVGLLMALSSFAEATTYSQRQSKLSQLTVTVKEIPNSHKTDEELIVNLPTFRQTMNSVLLEAPTEVIPVPGENNLDVGQLAPVIAPATGATTAEVEAWLAVGKQIWQIVKSNKPVVNVNLAKLSILPEVAPKWNMMENWKVAAPRSFEVTATNGFGIKVVTFSYRVSFNYGGQFNGLGMYLANLMILPETIDVVWGYKLDVEVQMGEVVNVGTTANQIPGVQMQVKHKIDTVLRSTTGSSTVFVNGKGDLVQLN